MKASKASPAFLKKSRKKLLVNWAGGGENIAVQVSKVFFASFLFTEKKCFLPSSPRGFA
jgi:hypothetical protein